MKCKCVLLLALVVGSVTAEKPKAEPKAVSKADQVVALTKKVEHIVGGLEGIYAAQTKSADGPTKFGQILKPFLAEMNNVLTECKTDKKLTEDQKLEKLKNAQASVKGLTKDMSSLTDDLHAEGEQEQESLLMGILMARQTRPEAEQLEVCNDAQFKNLEVVKHVLAHRDSKKSLVEQIAMYIDQKHPPKDPTPFAPANASLADITAGIVSQLETQLHKMEKHLALQEQLHKNITEEMSAGLKKDEVKVSHLKGTDAAEKKKKANRAMKMVRRMTKKEDREYNKQHAMEVHDVATLKKAIESVKKGDMKALATAQQALTHSLKSMTASTGDFLHFLQMSDYTDSAKDGACPYCKAQCLEKCHAGGTSFMSCMTSCADVGN